MTRSRATKKVKSSMTLFRVGISLASEAVMAEIDVLLSIASRAPSVWLKSVRKHLISSDSMPTSGFFAVSGLLMLCSALPSTA